MHTIRSDDKVSDLIISSLPFKVIIVGGSLRKYAPFNVMMIGAMASTVSGMIS